HFFFSSRRRHTRSDRDWSSDVCSSDLRLAVSAPRSTVEKASSSRAPDHGRKRGDAPRAITSNTASSNIAVPRCRMTVHGGSESRSEEHTSELQSRSDLVCRLLLEKKQK